MTINFTKGIFDANYVPTVIDVYKGSHNINGNKVEVNIIDTSGDELMGDNRETVYGGADCFMLCTAVDNRDSLEFVTNFRTEIRNISKAPILLVGTKTDIRDENSDCISTEELNQKRDELKF